MPLVAGVDSSTQGCKVIIVDAESGKLHRFSRVKHPEGTEIDPEVWWQALRQAIDDAGGLDDVSAISVAGQQHGMVLLDSAGCVIRPALLWNDVRSAPQARELIKLAGGPSVYAKRIGIVPVASFTATKIRWVLENEPENAAKTAAICLPHDYLTWRLLGYGPSNPNLEALVTDRSDASGTAYWSSVNGEYDWKMFELAFDREGREARGADAKREPTAKVILPRVLGPSDKAGYTLGGLMVGPGTGDNAGGALGLAVSPGDTVVSIGTSGAVFAPTTSPICDPSGIVAGFSDATGINLPLVCTLNGARVLDAVRDILNTNYDEFDKLAQQAQPGSGGLVLIPYFEGERTPNLPNARGSMHGISLENLTRENMARAYIEGVLCSMLEGVRESEKIINHASERILLIGGAAASSAVQSCAARIFECPVVIPSPGEYVARGAAFQAAWALRGGCQPDWGLEVDRVLKSNPARDIYHQYAVARDSMYGSFKGE